MIYGWTRLTLAGNLGAFGHVVPVKSGEAQLARVLHSRTFSQAPTLSQLLRYLVEHTRERNGEQLKEYSLGAEFFRRGESLVPVHARRLRRKLKEYYDTEGQADVVVIELPKGHYVVTDSTLHLVENFEAHRDPIDDRRLRVRAVPGSSRACRFAGNWATGEKTRPPSATSQSPFAPRATLHWAHVH